LTRKKMAAQVEMTWCSSCRQQKQYGHVDVRDAHSTPDQLQWFCEDCWQKHVGVARTCARCFVKKDQGAVDSRDKRWYCEPCWQEYEPAGTSAPTALVGNGTHAPQVLVVLVVVDLG